MTRHPVIRLRRGGHKHHPVFHIVSIFKSKRNRGNYITRLGHLNLTKGEHSLFLDMHLLGTTLNNGAVLNKTVKKYISKFIIL